MRHLHLDQGFVVGLVPFYVVDLRTSGVVGTNSTPPCSVSCVVFSSGALIPVYGEQPIVWAIAWIAWGFPWDPLGQQLSWMQPSPGTASFIW